MRKPLPVLLTAIWGNILEYYDFTVYSVFVSSIGRTFFPTSSAFVQVLSTLSIFIVGGLARPVGSIFFGYIGDKYGRRLALIISMLGMTIATSLIGCIPSYETIGIYAPLLLIVMRLLQGLFISGEGVGTAIYILEHYQHLRPGFIAGLVNASNIVGTLLASFIGILIEHYWHHIDFAWRFAFLLGGCMGLVGFCLRIQIVETPIFKLLMQQKKILKAPFRAAIRTAWQAMFVTFCVAAMASSIVYLIKTYVNIYYHTVLQLDNKMALGYLSYASFITIISMPLFGGLADRIGPFRIVVGAGMALFLLILPTFLYIIFFPAIGHQIIALTILGTLSGSIGGVAYRFVCALFRPEHKFSGASFSYNIGIAAFGNPTPIISHWLIAQTGLPFAPAFYIMALSLLFLLIIYLMRHKISNLLEHAL